MPSAKTVNQSVEVAPVVTAEVTPVVTTEVTETEAPTEQNFEVRIDECTNSLQQILSLCKSVIAENKLLKRDYVKMNRELIKKTRKKKQTGGVKQPSGFAKPSKISKDLAKFLNVKQECMLARTDVTKRINSYIREHNLQLPENKRVILPDNKLSKLLNNGQEEVTYFNLQRFMKVHFPKD